MAKTADNKSLTDTVVTVADMSRHGDGTSVSEISNAVGRTSHLTVILLAASVAVTPLSGIPGMSTICGFIIALCAAQALLGHSRIWLPAFLRRKKVPNQRLKEVVSWLHQGAVYLDDATQTRLRPLVRGPARRALYIFFIMCGLVMPVLELIPFAASFVSGTVAFFSAALMARDGLWVACGVCLIALGATAILWAF